VVGGGVQQNKRAAGVKAPVCGEYQPTARVAAAATPASQQALVAHYVSCRNGKEGTVGSMRHCVVFNRVRRRASCAGTTTSQIAARLSIPSEAGEREARAQPGRCRGGSACVPEW